jgi:long-chain acyl-CoA synthetase
MLKPGEKLYPPEIRWDATLRTETLPDLLATAAVNFANRPVIEFRGQTISYEELQSKVEEMASAFLRAGYGKGSCVALFLGNSPDHPISFFGGLKAGARIAHLSLLDGERVLLHKLKDSGAKIVITNDHIATFPTALKFLQSGLIDRLVVCRDGRWGHVDGAVADVSEGGSLVTMEQFVGGATVPSEWPAIAEDDIALLQYTGGTTGLPKGAMLTHANLTSAVSIIEIWLAPTRKSVDRVICALPLFHIFALTVVLLFRIRRGDLILLHQRFDVEAVLNDIARNRATVLPAVPTMWIAIANHKDLLSYDLSSLTHCMSGGAPLPVEVARVLEQGARWVVKSGWGMTETCGPGSIHPLAGPNKHDSIGLMMPMIELDVVSVDDPRCRLSPGQIGELRVKGPNVTQGYWNRPEETAEAFVDGRFLTGDIGYMDEDGYFYLVDRKKDMIISGGFNVYPQLIEQVIYEHPSVQEVGVVGIPDSYRGESAKAFVKLKVGEKPFTLEDLRSFLVGKLGKHEMPAALEFLDELPKTSAGKLSRRELRGIGSS